MEDLTLYAPYTVHEADFALYLADRDGNVTDQAKVFLGGRLEDLTPELDFTKVRLDRHGDPFGRNYHSDEEHRIVIKNLWVMEKSSRTMPRIKRNQQYVLVVRWFDLETKAWVLRTYSGVTADGQRLLSSDQVFHQDVPFTARHLDESSGVGEPPDLTASIATLSVLYVTADDSAPVYSYDRISKVFTAIDPVLATEEATIAIDGTSWKLLIGLLHASVVPVMEATVGGVSVAELTAIGGTFPLGDSYPRVEFWIGPTRVASVTRNGELAVPDLFETDTEPDIDGPCFRLALEDDTWVGTIAQGMMYARSFNEDL